MELERLFMLQDKPFPDAKKIMMVSEICTGAYPFTSIVQGIKSLHTEDLRSIKLFLLIEAISNFMDQDAGRFNCPICLKDGCVELIDAIGQRFALACTCSNGDIVANMQHLVRWNGKALQTSNGRILFRSRDDRSTYVPEPPQADDQRLKDLVDSVGGTVVDQGEATW
ncbi:MAG TPA: hypothetical protein VIJ14_03180 [Rhabdochlamydiaceae bacterium]